MYHSLNILYFLHHYSFRIFYYLWCRVLTGRSQPYQSFFHFFNLTVFSVMYHLVINVILKNKYEFGLGYGCSASVMPGIWTPDSWKRTNLVVCLCNPSPPVGDGMWTLENCGNSRNQPLSVLRGKAQETLPYRKWKRKTDAQSCRLILSHTLWQLSTHAWTHTHNKHAHHTQRKRWK